MCSKSFEQARFPVLFAIIAPGFRHAIAVHDQRIASREPDSSHTARPLVEEPQGGRGWTQRLHAAVGSEDQRWIVPQFT